ncbi:metallophosphoesterase family protein [Xanthobacteraceae bacterium A53D]
MIAVISDIHGNLPALEAVLARIDALGCTRIISLGDVVGYYAQPGPCIDLLRQRGIVNILGNHDHYIVSGTGCPRSKLVSEITEYQRTIISPDQRDWLAGSLSCLREGRVAFYHGGPDDPVDQYIYEVSPALFPQDTDTLFAGHTHVQVLINLGGKTFCNPGAVGQPRDGDWRAAFAILSAEGITLHRAEYDVDRTVFHMNAAGFPARCTDNLRIGAQIGGRIDRIAAA